MHWKIRHQNNSAQYFNYLVKINIRPKFTKKISRCKHCLSNWLGVSSSNIFLYVVVSYLIINVPPVACLVNTITTILKCTISFDRTSIVTIIPPLNKLLAHWRTLGQNQALLMARGLILLKFKHFSRFSSTRTIIKCKRLFKYSGQNVRLQLRQMKNDFKAFIFNQ